MFKRVETFLGRYFDVGAVEEFITTNYEIMVGILTVILCILFFFLMLIYMADAIKDAFLRARVDIKERITGAMERSKSKTAFSYSYQAARLDALGVTYYSKGKITPLTFLSYKLASLAAGFVLGIMFNPIIGVIFAFAAFKLPDIIMVKRNKEDNEKMLRSIIDVYDVILLQINSGEYITQVLIDAYRVATHPRLKNALMGLAGDIVTTNNLVLSMEKFGSMFENGDINNLVALVRQLKETGMTADMLIDIKRHLATLQESYNRYERGRVRRLGGACAIAVFIGTVAVMGYVCLPWLFSLSSTIIQ